MLDAYPAQHFRFKLPELTSFKNTLQQEIYFSGFNPREARSLFISMISGSVGSGAFPSPFFSFFSFLLFGSSLVTPSSPRPRGLALPRPRLLRYSPSKRSLSRRSLLLERLLCLPRSLSRRSLSLPSLSRSRSLSRP